MFIVASGLSEGTERERERERLTSSLSLHGMNVTAYTFEAVKTVFVELFCTPKSSMENPSLRVSGTGSSTNRTFIVEDRAEDDFGHWATDDVVGEQGYIDDESSCFWTWDDNEYAWQSRPFKGRQVKRTRGKGKGKGRSNRTGRAFCGEEHGQDPELWSEEDFAWWSEGKKDKKGLTKGNDGFQKGEFRPCQMKAQAKITPRAKAMECEAIIFLDPNINHVPVTDGKNRYHTWSSRRADQ